MSLFSNLRREIEFCRQTYPGFDDVGDAMESLFAAAEEFARGTVTEVDSEYSVPGQQELDALHRQGKPLCPDLRVDRENFEKAVSVVCNGVIGMYPAAEGAIRRFQEDFLATAFSESTVLFVFDEVSVTRLLSISSDDDETMGRDLSTLIVSLTLFVLYRGQMDEDLRELNSRLWDEGICPVCGQSPHYGLLHSEDGSRLLECWMCGTRWSFLRLKCPHCENDDHKHLGYFTVESMEFVRVYFCEDCNQYFKVFDLQEQEKEDADLLIHNLATLSVDLVAASEGFRAGSGLQWTEGEVH